MTKNTERTPEQMALYDLIVEGHSQFKPRDVNALAAWLDGHGVAIVQQPAPVSAEVEEKAALWDLLMSSAEFRHVGSAGLTPDGREWTSSYGHLGLALSTHRSLHETDPDPSPRGREMLMVFLGKRAALSPEVQP